jgi:hypothetical protein
MSYNPNEINIDTKLVTISDLLLIVWFQNVNSPWNDRVKSSLIESILIRIPIQSFYLNRAIKFDEKDRDFWKIIDGKKRLLSIKEFCMDKTLRLQGLEYLSDLEGKSFDELPRRYQRRLEETILTVHSIETGTTFENYNRIVARLA